MIDYPFKTHGSLYTLLHSSKILELYSVENVKQSLWDGKHQSQMRVKGTYSKGGLGIN